MEIQRVSGEKFFGIGNWCGFLGYFFLIQEEGKEEGKFEKPSPRWGEICILKHIDKEKNTRS